MTIKAKTKAPLLFATLVACFVSISAQAVVVSKPASVAPDIMPSGSEFQPDAAYVAEPFCRECFKAAHSGGKLSVNASDMILPTGAPAPDAGKAKASAAAGSTK